MLLASHVTAKRKGPCKDGVKPSISLTVHFIKQLMSHGEANTQISKFAIIWKNQYEISAILNSS
jgi:hypothetical protein